MLHNPIPPIVHPAYHQNAKFHGCNRINLGLIGIVFATYSLRVSARLCEFRKRFVLLQRL